MSKKRKKTQAVRKVEEIDCYANGYLLVAGVDEVGRGCLAGPVVASAVIMPQGQRLPWHKLVKDSKLLTAEQRAELSPYIHKAALSVGTGVVEAYIIDQIGMTAAVHLAMRRAVNNLLPQPDFLLIDYLTIPGLNLPQKGVREGDTLCFSIACASIVAKVYRDKLMCEMDRYYPGYGFANHKGYGTAEHQTSLRKLGSSPIHRQMFHLVKNLAQLSFDDWLERAARLDPNGT